MPDPRLQQAVAFEMQARPPRVAQPSTSSDPLANMTPASDEDEAYADDIFDHVASRLYRKDDQGEFVIAERVEKMVGDARQDQKADALMMAAAPFMEVANEAIMQSPTPPPDEVGDHVALRIVDAIMEIADETGAAPYSEELAETVLVGVRHRFIEAHPELYGDQQPQPGGKPNGGLQSQPRTGVSGGGSGGFRQV